MRTYNVAPSIPDDRDVMYVLKPGPFPDNFDQIPNIYEVYELEDQSTLNLCVENGIVVATDEFKKDGPGSRMFLSYYARQLENVTGNVGTSVRDGVRAAYHYGIPPEALWAYLLSLIDTEPNAAAKAAALQRMVLSYKRIPVPDLSTSEGQDQLILNVKSAIAEGYPVIIGVPVGKEYENLTGPWQTHKMQPVALGPNSNNGNTLLGGHCMLLRGWDDRIVAPCPGKIRNGSFLDQGSWGKNFGDGGFTGYPFEAFVEDMAAWGELWIIDGFANIAPKNYVTPPAVVLKWYWDNYRRDVTDPMDKDVQGWAMNPGGEIAFLECYQSIIDAGVQARLKVLRGS